MSNIYTIVDWILSHRDQVESAARNPKRLGHKNAKRILANYAKIIELTDDIWSDIESYEDKMRDHGEGML